MIKCAWWGCTRGARSGNKFCNSRCKNKYWVDRRRRQLKVKLVQFFGGKCIRCGYDECIAALEFHHRDKELKSFTIAASGHTRAWARLVEEAKKCDLLCANHHREEEFKKTADRWADL